MSDVASQNESLNRCGGRRFSCALLSGLLAGSCLAGTTLMAGENPGRGIQIRNRSAAAWVKQSGFSQYTDVSSEPQPEPTIRETTPTLTPTPTSTTKPAV